VGALREHRRARRVRVPREPRSSLWRDSCWPP
jgi:hypothetical protein